MQKIWLINFGMYDLYDMERLTNFDNEVRKTNGLRRAVPKMKLDSKDPLYKKEIRIKTTLTDSISSVLSKMRKLNKNKK
jgi:hypothetical protein